METNSSGWGIWTGIGGAATNTRQTSGGLLGSAFQRVEFTTVPTSGGGFTFSYITGSPGERFYIAAYVKPSVTVNMYSSTHGYLNAAAVANALNVVSPIISCPAGQWTRVHMYATMPDGCNQLQGRWYVQGAGITATGQTIDIDCAIAEVVTSDSPTEYFDGDMPGFEWSGTAHASKPRTISSVNRVNLCPNPQPTTTGTWGVYSTPTLVTAPWDSSRKAMRVIGNGVGTPYIFSQQSSRAFFAGQTVTVSATVDMPAGCRYYFRVHRRSPNTYYGGQALTAVATTQREVKRLSHTFTLTENVPAGQLDAAFVYAGANGTSAETNGMEVFMGDALIELSSTPSQYFDGGSAGAAWSGTANSSPSYFLSSDSSQQILSNLNQYDGLSLEGTKVSFSTKYTTAGEAKATYDLGVYRAFTAIGVHTESKNSLFVDGKLVAEVDLTEDQRKGTYVVTDGKLYSGLTTSGSGLAVNAVGIYPLALTGEAIAAMYMQARDVPTGEEVAQQFNGRYIAMSREASNIFMEQTWSTEEDWLNANLLGVAVLNDRLVPQEDENGVSVAGSWIDSIPLTGAETTSIYGVNFDWDGEGAVVEASVDGTTWASVKRGVNVSVVPAGFDPTDKEVLVRISFPGGITDDTSYIDNLEMVAVRTATSNTIGGHQITLTNAYQQKSYPPIEMRDNWGAEIVSGGSIVIGPDTADPVTDFKTIEVWIKPTGSTAPTISVTGTQYRNGAASSAALPVGQWTLVHITKATAITGDITITGPAQVGQVVLYESELSAGTVADITRAYTGRAPLLATDSSILTMGAAPDAKIYAHDWSILGAG
jgi:hypothetical protein